MSSLRITTRSRLVAALMAAASPAFGLLIQASAAETTATALPPGYEAYSRRPDILQTPAKPHPELGAAWEKLKRGHVEMVAMLLEMYPDRELYFLARDSELLYDLARLATQNDPALQKRVRLLNVSQVNMNDPNLRKYLEQEGISQATLKAGKKIMFVDTGFQGTIPNNIASLFPDHLHANLGTHLMSSGNPKIPSSRVFLSSINPAAAVMPPEAVRGSLVAYEHIPRFTGRSGKFSLVNGRWEAISETVTRNADEISKPTAVAYMEDLRHAFERPETQKLLTERRALWRQLQTLSQAGTGRAELVTEIRKLLDAHPGDPHIESIARDFIDMQAKTLPTEAGARLTLSDLNLYRPDPVSVDYSNREYLMQRFPEWKPHLENPEAGIQRLLQQGDYPTLSAITEAIHDGDYVHQLTRKLGASELKPEGERIINSLIQKQDPGTLAKVANLIGGQPAPIARRLSQEMIGLGTPDALRALSDYALPKMPLADSKDLIAQTLQKGDQSVLKSLVTRTLPKHPVAETREIIRQAIDKGGPRVHQSLITNTFAGRPFTEVSEHLREIAQRAEPEVIPAFDRIPPPGDPEGTRQLALIRKSLEIESPEQRKALLAKDWKPAPAAPKTPANPRQPLLPGPGDKFFTAQGRALTVESLLEESAGYRIYKARTADGNPVTLKLPKGDDRATRIALLTEKAKAEQLRKQGIAHAQVLESESGYVVREWANGIRGDHWMESWKKNGMNREAPEFVALKNLYESSSQKGIPVGSLSSKNLIWNGTKWIVVDASNIQGTQTVKEMLVRTDVKAPVARTQNFVICPQEFTRKLFH